MSDKPTVMVPDLCKLHQGLLVHQVGFSPADPWQVLIVMAQIALMQAMTADPSVHARIGDDIRGLEALGCFACYKPDAFGEVVQAAQTGGLAAIKALGERWVKDGAKP